MTADLERLRTLADALNASVTAIRRDQYSDQGSDDGDYGLFGKTGHIYVDGSGFWLYAQCADAPRRWTNIKRAPWRVLPSGERWRRRGGISS